MESSLQLAAQGLLDSLKRKEDKNDIIECWGKLSSLINRYISYDSIPYFYEVPMAMYQYVMQYSSKRAEENTIRAINTFGVLMNAFDYGKENEKGSFLIYISLLLSRYKSNLLNSKYYSIFPIAKPKITEYFNETVKDYGNTKANFDAIKLYIISEIKSKYLQYIDTSLLNEFELDCDIFKEEYNNESYDKTQMPNGLDVLWDCYNEMLYAGKCPIFVSLPTNTEIYNKTRGLIPDSFSLFTFKYLLQESSGRWAEGGVSARIDISVSNNNFIIKNNGVDENYLKSELCLPIKEVVVRKVEQYIEFSFSVHISKYGEVDNIPMSMEIHFDKYNIKSITFTFMVGDKGYMRQLEISGNAK